VAVGCIPIRTHLVTPDEDIVAVVCRYVQGVAERGDLIVISETAAAVSQGRCFRPESVRPRRLARFLCRFADKDGSLGTPAAMELALQEVGTARILAACAAAAAGRLLRRRGWFFRVAGRRIAAIDDIGGTLPPFESHTVLAPREPRRIAEAVRRATGVDAAVVDTNDLGRADVLAFTGPYRRQDLERLLESNPLGNDDEQTPLAVVKGVRALHRRLRPGRWQPVAYWRPRPHLWKEAP
jgi:F420-0:gamma-glutamyl ligase